MLTKTLKQDEIICGEIVDLVPLSKWDLRDLAECLRADKEGYLGRFCLKDFTSEQAIDYILGLINEGDIYVWNYFTKDDEPQRMGFIFLTDVCDFAAEISGLLDSRLTRKNKRINGRTFPEDAQVTLIKHCFDCGLERVSTEVLEENRKAVALQKRIGFTQEGIRRKCFKVNGELKNMVHFAILKEDWNNKEVQVG